MRSKVAAINVPLPKEVVELARSRGLSPEELAEAARKLLILEIVAMESKLAMEDALEISEKGDNKSLAKVTKGEEIAIVLDANVVIACSVLSPSSHPSSYRCSGGVRGVRLLSTQLSPSPWRLV